MARMVDRRSGTGRGLLARTLAMLLVAACALPTGFAGTGFAPGPAVGGVPEGLVVDQVPEFLGPLYRVDELEAPGMVVLVTLPVARDTENWRRILEACFGDDGGTGDPPDIEACADRHPELLDNRDWTWISLWSLGEGAPGEDAPMRLLAVAHYGRMMGETAAGRIFLSELPGTAEQLDSWRGALLGAIALADIPTLDELHEEVIEYTVLAEDGSVKAAWQRARYHLLDRPCTDITGDLSHCADCCDERWDACDGECDTLGLRATTVGCAGGAIGCLMGELWPAAYKCCAAVGSALGGFMRWGCGIWCRRVWRECRKGCRDKF